jgi:putative CocE/NonD family hydrolase
VQGEGGWREFDDWPPPATPTEWYLHADGRLATEPPAPDASADPERYRYDPADPTPSIGGIGMLTGGAIDNRGLEARDDVLVYTSDELTEPLELVGPVEAVVHLESTLDHVDVFVRVCDVHPDGASFNVCDALQRYTPDTIARDEHGVFTARFDLWPIGHRFAAGHRLRVQVASGCHPVYARNLGTGEPATTAVDMVTNDVAVHHAPGRESKVTLPHLA